MTAWRAFRGAFSPARRRASRWSACRWAVMSPSRSCARRPSGSRDSRCSTPRRVPTRPSRAPRAAQIALAAEGRLGEVLDACFPLLVHHARRHDAALRQVLDLMAEEVGAAAFIRQQQANLSRADSRPRLGGIRVPTLVLVGEGDELTPPERAAEMARAIPGSREVRVPDCGHLSTLERPDEVTRALLAWLEA